MRAVYLLPALATSLALTFSAAPTLAQTRNCEGYKQRLEALVAQEAMNNSIDSHDMSPQAYALERQYYACLNRARPSAGSKPPAGRPASAFPGGGVPWGSPSFDTTAEDLQRQGKQICPSAQDGSFVVCNQGTHCAPDGLRCLPNKAARGRSGPAFRPVKSVVCDYDSRGRKVCKTKRYR